MMQAMNRGWGEKDRAVPVVPLGNLVEQIMMQAMNRGWGEKDRAVPVVLQEESAGVEMRLP